MATTPFVRRRGGELLAGGAGHPDTCSGDSGGPAIVDIEGHRYLVGITSRAATHGCGNGGIYTLAPQYEWWLIAPESAPAYAGEETAPMGSAPDEPAALAMKGVVSCAVVRGPGSAPSPSLWLLMLLGFTSVRRRAVG